MYPDTSRERRMCQPSRLPIAGGARRHAAPSAAMALSFVWLIGPGLTSVDQQAMGAPPYVTAHYRFEEGTAGAAATGPILDSVDSSPDGLPGGGPVYHADVPMATIPQTGESNTLSLEFTGSESVRFDTIFAFHAGQGDATIELFIKAPDQSHHSLFWTRGDDADTNRYNIAVNPGGGLGLDYRDPSGSLHMQAGVSSMTVAPGNWAHIAVVRDTVSFAPAHVHRFYRDGVLQGSSTDPSPNLPTSPQWTMSGRSSFRFVGLVDEVRLSNRALSPADFLIAPGSQTCGGPTISFDPWPQSVLPVGQVVEPTGVGPGGMEVEYVLDESGSISASDFYLLKDFAVNMANGMIFGPFGLAGLVMFSTDARLVLPLTSNKQVFVNTVNAVIQQKGETCIGCGINAASDDLVNRGAPQRSKMILVVTDGMNSRPDPDPAGHLQAAVSLATSRGHILYAIGVGPNVSLAQLQSIATPLFGVQTVYQVTAFTSLSTIINSIQDPWRLMGPHTVDVVMPDGTSQRLFVSSSPLGAFKTPAWTVRPGPNVFQAWIGTLCGARTATLTLTGVPVPGDFNRDADVDFDDWAQFESCASGPSIPRAEIPVCEEADLDHDGDIDQSDFAIFQQCFSGENVLADPNCGN